MRLFADAADKLLAAVAEKRGKILDGKIDTQMLALGDALTKKVDATAEEWRSHGNVRKLWQRDKSLWTDTDEDRWLGWLDACRRRTDQELPGLRRGDQARRFCRRAPARHGRLEPRPGSVGDSVRPQTKLSALAHSRLHRAGADQGDRSHARSRQDAVHRVEQVGLHDRAQYLQGLFLQARGRRGRRSEGRPAFRRRHRSGLGAGASGQGAKLSQDILRRAQHRRALLRAVAVRPGAGCRRRHRHCGIGKVGAR